MKVLFVCVGNSCRSQMAEGFARAYGSDVVEPFSAGLAPAGGIAPETKKVMLEKNIDLEMQFPKDLRLVAPGTMDLVINLSGYQLPEGWQDVREWVIRDPMGQNEKFHRQIRDEVESRVMDLLLDLRHRAAADERPPRLGRQRI